MSLTTREVEGVDGTILVEGRPKHYTRIMVSVSGLETGHGVTLYLLTEQRRVVAKVEIRGKRDVLDLSLALLQVVNDLPVVRD